MEEEGETSSLISQDKVLVERDGQFELVNATDVQATVLEGDQAQGVIVQSVNITDTALSQSENGSRSIATDEPSKAGNEILAVDEKGHIEQVINLANDQSFDTSSPQLRNDSKSIATDEPSKAVDAVTLVVEEEGHREEAINIANDQSVNTSQSPRPPDDISSRSAPSVATNKRIEELQSHGQIHGDKTNKRVSKRLASAPVEHSSTTERTLLNERAFQFWMERKNAELQKKRYHDMNKVQTTESNEHKLLRNQEAFESWLKNKQRQLIPQKANGQNSHNCSMSEEEKREKQKEMFRTWLKKKAEERSKLLQIEEYKQDQLSEIAKTKGPDVSQKAYKQLVLLLYMCEITVSIDGYTEKQLKQSKKQQDR